MDHLKYFKELFESIPDYRKIVLLMFLFKNNDDLLSECGILKSDINRLCLGFEKTLIERNEEYLEYKGMMKTLLLKEL